MANKYANLVGTNKIKDEYTKINTGFDGVETDIDALNDLVDALDSRVDTIITTPIDGEAAAQEIVDARASAVKSKTFATLDARFEETEQDVESHMAENVSQIEVHGLKIESGTWTPVLEGATVAGNNTYSTQNGTYHKIGKYVRLNFRVVITAKDESMSGALRIGGIPFANARASNLSDVGRLWDAKGWIAPLNFNQLTICGSAPTKIVLIKLSDKGNASELVAQTEFGNEIALGGTFDYITS